MKHANLQVGNKETGEVILIVNKEEGQILVLALENLSKLHPRRGKVAKLLKEVDHLAVF